MVIVNSREVENPKKRFQQKIKNKSESCFPILDFSTVTGKKKREDEIRLPRQLSLKIARALTKNK
jgi:hypothetical protein